MCLRSAAITVLRRIRRERCRYRGIRRGAATRTPAGRRIFSPAAVTRDVRRHRFAVLCQIRHRPVGSRVLSNP